MNVSLRGWRGVVLSAAVICLAAALPADAGPKEASSPKGATAADVAKGLKALGLKPQQTGSRKDFSFRTDYEGRQWELTFSAVLSKNKQMIWLIAWLDHLPASAEKVPRTALLRLLAANDRLGKATFFSYIPQSRRFVLQRVIPNRNISPASLRDHLKDLGAVVAETFPYWSVAQWSGQGSAGDFKKRSEEIFAQPVSSQSESQPEQPSPEQDEATPTATKDSAFNPVIRK